ncbi:MAG: hypothetical protein F6K42_04410 [Leptolyngbya sp. SIO1D8]|nr:hypothetical protein [Leptolyngbya sp. SIO1D8]
MTRSVKIANTIVNQTFGKTFDTLYFQHTLLLSSGAPRENRYHLAIHTKVAVCEDFLGLLA